MVRGDQVDLPAFGNSPEFLDRHLGCGDEPGRQCRRRDPIGRRDFDLDDLVELACASGAACNDETGGPTRAAIDRFISLNRSFELIQNELAEPPVSPHGVSRIAVPINGKWPARRNIHAGRIHQDGLFTSPPEISKPGIDDDEASKYSGQPKPRFCVRTLAVLGRWVAGRLKGRNVVRHLTVEG